MEDYSLENILEYRIKRNKKWKTNELLIFARDVLKGLQVALHHQ